MVSMGTGFLAELDTVVFKSSISACLPALSFDKFTLVIFNLNRGSASSTQLREASSN
jgi:hypothetical protein